MEVYVDDMFVKSLKTKDRVLRESFSNIKKVQNEVESLKCAFGVASGKFLGYLDNQRGVAANPEKIKALVEMRSLQKHKKVQSLTKHIVALSCFVLKTNRCLLFFKVLK